MTGRPAIIALASIGLLLGTPAVAQPAKKIYRIGYIQTSGPTEVVHVTRAFEEGLPELGWFEGKNIVIDRRWAEGRQERLPALANEVVRLNPDVIVTGANPVIAAVKQATSTIPVVMAASRDPVGSGFVTNLARPGGNITGLTNTPLTETVGKNLELLKEVLPKTSRVAILLNPVPPGADIFRKATEDASRKLGMTPIIVEVRSRDELERAFETIAGERADGLFVQPDPMFFTAADRVVRLAAKHRLPAVYWQREFVDAGGLMSYGTSVSELYRRAAGYVDKILKGAKPAELPIYQAANYELVINASAARTLGVTFPLSVRQRGPDIVN